ncbi:hypothetical protein [Endozoicomonas sp. OPT23]|uniref:hypothetical protein n=1 Tax=Endozoicomonas sp. OPT23 TaxID=2072845 RepID=UPI00129A1170|nr:hypothetical protein [Endozoicomonas sp. OPT23]
MQKGQVFRDKDLDQCFRITYLPVRGVYTYIINLPDKPKNTFPTSVETQSILKRFEEGVLEVVEDSPYNLEPQTLSDKQKDRASELWLILEPYLINQPDIFIPSVRGEAFTAAHAAHGISKETFYLAVSRYFQKGQSELALAPDYNKRGILKKANNSTENDENPVATKVPPKKRGRPSKEHGEGRPSHLFHSQFDYALKHFHISEKQTIKSSYKRMIRAFFPGCNRREVPSYKQMLDYNNKDYQKMKLFRQRYGKIVVPRSDRPMFSSSVANAPYPGSVFEIDATIANVYVLSSYFDYDDPVTPHEIVIIGRPVIYHIVDVFSRMIVGLFIGVEGPSWAAASMAIRNLLEDKQLFCLKYGIDLNDLDNQKLEYLGTELFPLISGLSEKLRADHGEFRGDKPDGLIELIGQSIENHKVYCPDLKGTTEQSFDISQKKGQYTQLYTVEQSFKVRDQILGKGIDPRREACLTLREFIGLYLRIILKLNASVRVGYPRTKDMIKKGVPAIPVKLWQYGIENIGGVLRTPPIQQVQKALLPRKPCSTNRQGIHFFKDQYYFCSYAEKRGWFERGNYQKNITLAYDPYSMDQAYLVTPKDNKIEYIPCKLTPRCRDKYQGTTFKDAEFILRYEEEENIQISHDQNMNDTTETAINEKIAQTKSRLPEKGNTPATWKGMRDNRHQEAKREAQQEKVPEPECPEVSAQLPPEIPPELPPQAPPQLRDAPPIQAEPDQEPHETSERTRNEPVTPRETTKSPPLSTKTTAEKEAEAHDEQMRAIRREAKRRKLSERQSE